MIGSILFNGNIIRDVDFIYKFRDRILQSNHIDPHVHESKKVLLVTGAWEDREFAEAHLKEALANIGVSSFYRKGFDQNIQNLSVYYEWSKYKQRNPYVGDIYENSVETLLKIKQFYQQRNAELVDLLQNHTKMIKSDFPHVSLADILRYSTAEQQWRVPQMNSQQLLKHYACTEIQKTLAYLIGGDELQAKISAEIQEHARVKSGILADPFYQERRKNLVDRILSANSIFIFGGNIVSLYYALKFWELGGALAEALLRGTNFYTVSAGTMVLGQKIIIYDDYERQYGNKVRHFEFFDNGFGLVTKITLFPHCEDRIQTDDPDNLAYLAHRFQGRVCVGLNQNSFLLLDAHRSQDGKVYPRYTSVGTDDGVYVFDPSGKKLCLDYGQQLTVPGTLIWEQTHRDSETPPEETFSYTGQTMWAADK